MIYHVRTEMRQGLNTCNETEIKADFHFSHYKSMETLSYQSNQSINATVRKNNNFVEANTMYYENFCKVSALPIIQLLRSSIFFFFPQI